MCKQVKGLIIVKARKRQKIVKWKMLWEKKDSQNINHQNSILFSHTQGGRSIFFVLDQYLDIKLYPRRVKDDHVELWWFFCRNIEMKISRYQIISSNIPGEWGRGVGVPRSSAKPPQAADALSRWEEQRHFPFSLFKLISNGFLWFVSCG